MKGENRIVSQQTAKLANWRTVRLGEMIDLNPIRTLDRGKKAPFAAMADVLEHQRQLQALDTREYHGAGSRFNNGDTLLARITPSLENGKTAWVSGLPGDTTGHGSTEFIVLSAKEGLTDSLFIYYLARSPQFRSYAISQMTGTSGRQRVPTDSLESFVVDIPPFDEQRTIAKVLGALDDKIEQNQQLAHALERLARTIFRGWFVDFEPVKAKAAGAASFPSVPQHVFDTLPTSFVDSEIGPVPEGWNVERIGEVVTIKGGSTPSTKNPDYWDGGKLCWATPRDLSRLSHPVLLDTERYITNAGMDRISSGLLPAGTVLMSSRAPVGYLAISGVPTAVNQGFIAMICNGPLPPTFVLNWAHSLMETIKARASGTTFPEISKKIFRPLPVIRPTGDVISAYRQAVEPLFDLLTACVKENSCLARTRDYILPQLLKGQVCVKATNG